MTTSKGALSIVRACRVYMAICLASVMEVDLIVLEKIRIYNGLTVQCRLTDKTRITDKSLN